MSNATPWNVNRFVDRHIGPGADDVQAMLATIGQPSLDALMDTAVPKAIRTRRPLDLPSALSEQEALRELKEIAAKNQVFRNYIGLGYNDCVVPAPIQRHILENPGWYTQYTPYQAEIAQGRLEALLNFQTMVSDLTGLAVANGSLLDEGTAAAEAMALSRAGAEPGRDSYFVSDECFPQTIETIRTRAEPLGVKVVVGKPVAAAIDDRYFGLLLQYPSAAGGISDPRPVIAKAKSAGVVVAMAADILALALLTPPGELGADIALGSTQRFGIPLGFGGPHAAYFATKEDFKRKIPGRIVGVSKDKHGNSAIRLALQTREQHIRRDKATSNICTAQVLLAVMASMYAVYHGPDGIKRIAASVHAKAQLLDAGLRELGLEVVNATYFDTLTVKMDAGRRSRILAAAKELKINLRVDADGQLGASVNENTSENDLAALLSAFAEGKAVALPKATNKSTLPPELTRTSEYLTHAVFRTYHSETELMRYIKKLEARDLSLTSSMIPLGSCTMKLNAASELFPVTWPEFNALHPFAPGEQTAGYREMFKQLESWLCEITGFDAVSLQPNSGAQGELAGLMAIRGFHLQNGHAHRDVCLIPKSAHGTNPASAVMAGMRVVAVECDTQGNIELKDLQAKAELHKDSLAALMVTYPSTHGVFEDHLPEICSLVHGHGGQVYMDGANMNAQVGFCRPGEFGPDVCHLNLHKTFCIPHGGGGPGMGPIGVKKHLAPFLPTHPLVEVGGKGGVGPISAAPWGSASILPISWMYIRMMGPDGLAKATQVAILNANYLAKKLDPHFPVLFRGLGGLCAHECIVDLRGLKQKADIEVDDLAKRLMDYGFHAPTVSWPVPGTVMIEPTESESLEELDRFVDAMASIRAEIADIEAGKLDRKDNPLKNAPHTVAEVTGDTWPHAYSRQLAAFPSEAARARKFWPAVGRVDAGFGDRNLVCTCPDISEY